MPEHLLTVIVSKKSQCDFFVVARICSVSFDIQEEKTFHLRRNLTIVLLMKPGILIIMFYKVEGVGGALSLLISAP